VPQVPVDALDCCEYACPAATNIANKDSGIFSYAIQLPDNREQAGKLHVKFSSF
jgi:hypothetical protein